MVYKKNPRTDIQSKYADSVLIPFLVMLGKDDFDNNSVTVRHVPSNTTTPGVLVNDVVEFIRNFKVPEPNSS